VALQLEAAFGGKGHWPERLALHIVMALLHLLDGDEAAFERSFGKAYDMVYANGIRLPFAVHGKEMMAMVERVKKIDAGRYDRAWLDAVYADALSYSKRRLTMRKAYSGELYGPAGSALALTARENEALRYLAQGLTQQEIGKLMGISGNTVKKHVATIYCKLGAVNRADAIHIASIGGLVDVISG
jgi:LuxR family maltose regulon positive regulatory protein